MKRETKKAAKFLAFSFGDHLECHLCELSEGDMLEEFLCDAGFEVEPGEKDGMIEEAHNQVHRIREFLAV